MVDWNEARKAGAKLGKHAQDVDKAEVQRLSLKLLGVLADASSDNVRRRALDKARRMVSKR